MQNENFGPRGRKNDPHYRSRRLLTMAAERLGEKDTDKMLGLVRAGDRFGQVESTWIVKKAFREFYSVPDHALAGEFIDELIRDMADKTWPIEVRSLRRTFKRWRNQITAWHKLHISNGPTESMNNMSKQVKCVAFGFRSLRNGRIRSLLYADKPNRDLLPTITPR